MTIALGPLPDSLRSLVCEWAHQERGMAPTPGSYPPALVLRGGLGYVALLDVDGEVWIDHGDDRPPVVIPDGRHKVRCIAMGAKRRPKLACWLPQRPANALDCKWCQGVGWFDEKAPACRFCSGLGWTLETDASPFDPFERRSDGASLTLGPPPTGIRDFVRARLRAEETTEGPPDTVTMGFDLWVEHRLGVDGVLYALDGGDSVESIEDGPMKVYLVASFARRVPELRRWLPRRPADAIPCLTCGGIGPSRGDGPLCEPCLGLGWLRPEDG